jgi:hypothetical protein
VKSMEYPNLQGKCDGNCSRSCRILDEFHDFS